MTEVKSVVFRAICDKVPESRLYWRGIVLNGFKDNAWVRLPGLPETGVGLGQGASVHQEIYPEPNRTPYLLALNIPRQVYGVRHAEAPDAVFMARNPLEKRSKYEVLSTLSDTIRVNGGIARDFYLKLPLTVSARLRAEGRQLSRPGLSGAEKLQLLERFFHAQRLSYATSGLPVGSDPLDEFLFVKKKGNCEFFASSCATLLRLAGVPARLVGGYRGGTYNDLGGYYLVTEDMAHVWVEAYLEGKGWLTLDPSAWSVGFSRQDGVAQKLRMYLDAVDFYWNKAVINYDLEKQIALVRGVGGKARELHFPAWSLRRLMALSPWLLLPCALAALFLGRTGTQEARVLRSFLRVAARRFPDVCQEPCGLYEMAERIDDPHLQEFVAIYGAALYGDRRLGDAELAKLKELIRILGQHQS